jgi:hypothetical protein
MKKNNTCGCVDCSCDKDKITKSKKITELIKRIKNKILKIGKSIYKLIEWGWRP